MRRRDLIALLSSAMAQGPFAASAQQGDQLRQIGILAAAPFKPFDSFRQACASSAGPRDRMSSSPIAGPKATTPVIRRWRPS